MTTPADHPPEHTSASPVAGSRLDTWRRRLPLLALLVAVAGIAVGIALFEPGSATDWDKGRAELREVERDNAWSAPPITLSERVGCDVCPDWCGYVDLHIVPPHELLRDYRDNAALVYDVDRSLDTDYGVVHRAKAALRRTACIARRSDEVREALLQFLDDDAPLVQIATADLALDLGLVDRARGYEVLERYEDSHLDPGGLGFTAWALRMKWHIEDNPGWHWRPPRWRNTR